jgi:hypothetical protein
MFIAVFWVVLPCKMIVDRLEISHERFLFVGFVWFSLQTGIISLNIINQLIAVMVECGVLFEVRTEFLNII